MTANAMASSHAGKSLLRVAAIQWSRRTYRSYEDLRSSLLSPVLEAMRAGAELAAFSDGVADALASLLLSPGSDPPQARWAAGGLPLQGRLGLGLTEKFLSLGSSLAQAARLTISLGPVAAPTPDGFLRTAYLFGADGGVLGGQVQTHRTPSERAAGLAGGTELAPVDTPLGPVGLLSGVDVDYPEVGRVLALQGAIIFVHHGALHRFSEALALSRLWREVQANQVFGLEAYTVGQSFRGRSAVLAPVEITPDHTGWLARAPDDQQPAVIVADLDLVARHKLLDRYPILDLRNDGQYRRYLPMVYEAGAKGEDDGCS